MSIGQMAKGGVQQPPLNDSECVMDEQQQRLGNLISLAMESPGQHVIVLSDILSRVEECEKRFDQNGIEIDRRFPKGSSVLANIAEETKDRWEERFSTPFLPPGVTLSTVCLFKRDE